MGIWQLEKYKSNIALIDESGIRLTYEDLYYKTKEFCEGIKKRCLVFSLCRNTIGSVLGYVAFLNSGIVPVQLNSNLDENLLHNLMAIYSPTYIWVPVDKMDCFDNLDVLYTVFDYVLLRTHYDREYLLNDELALLITTSGSTGSPKFVRQSYTNIVENAVSIAKYLMLDESERPITTLPMNYVYGLSVINSHLLVGATILLTEKGIMQRDFWTYFKREKATSFGGVPYTFEMLDKLRFYSMVLPSLRTMTQAGGKLIPELQEKFARYALEQGKKFVVMYGASEATSRMGYLPPERAFEKKGAMGIPIPGGKFTLINDEGKVIREPYTSGELIYEGKNVTLGYAECGDDLAKGDERLGILETGDIAQFDEDGYYYIVGRKKRFLKIYGNRVNMDEIERLIKSRLEIEVACTGKDDHLYVFIIDENMTERVKELLVAKTNLNQAAFNVVVISDIPKTDSGKICYEDLGKYYS